MAYSLRRLSDGAGDSGPMSLAIGPRLGDVKDNARPEVGYAMRVGSFHARTNQLYDWWQTTLITEIIEDTPDKVIFRTGNSIYEWKII